MTAPAGTVPLSGQAYVAVGGGVAAVGAGLTVTGYGLRNGESLWQITLNERRLVDHVGARLAGRRHRGDRP